METLEGVAKVSQQCQICTADMRPLFSAEVLGKYQVAYFHCVECGFVRTESPYWLDEAYADAIAVTDTGVMARNVSIAAKLANIVHFCLDSRAAYLDVAGGYGFLTRLMRDYGIDYYWDDKYCANLVARGFERTQSARPFLAMSAFEVIEHVENPLAFLNDLMQRHDCKTLVFSTILYEGSIPPAPEWWYYSRITGQHISFFELRTLKQLASRLGLVLYVAGGMFILTDRPLRNTHLLRRVSGRLAPLLSPWVGWRLGSRTQADHLTMTRSLTKGNT